MIRRILEVLAIVAFLAAACTAELAIGERAAPNGPSNHPKHAR